MSTPILINKAQVLAAIEKVTGTAETLVAANGKTRFTAASAAEYNAPREERDVARATLSPIGTLESTKANNYNIECELNTPDSYRLETSLDATTCSWQSGAISRISFDSTPDLSSVSVGDLIVNRGMTNDVNNGTFIISAVNDGADWIEFINRSKTSATGDEASSPGVSHVLAQQEYGALLHACGTRTQAIVSVAIGDITGGPFVRGETVTQTTSGATGRVLIQTATGTSPLYLVPTNGIPFVTTKTLTGGTSGATATSSAGEVIAGYSVTPISSNLETATITKEEDGFAWKGRGGMGNATIKWESSKKAVISFAMQTARVSNTTGALTASVTQYTDQPPIWQNATLTLDSFAPVVRSAEFDLGNNVVLRENANASGDTGIEAARITGRVPKLKISLEHDLAANYDFYTAFDAGTDIVIKFQTGSASEKTIYFFADQAEISEIPLGENANIRMLELTFTLKTSDTNEYKCWEMALL